MGNDVKTELLEAAEKARMNYTRAREQVNRIKDALEEAIDLVRGTWKAYEQALNAIRLFDSRQ